MGRNWIAFFRRYWTTSPIAACYKTTLTRQPLRDMRPAWSPDGKRIAFTSARDGNLEIGSLGAVLFFSCYIYFLRWLDGR
jgi:hypothetical protein